MEVGACRALQVAQVRSQMKRGEGAKAPGEGGPDGEEVVGHTPSELALCPSKGVPSAPRCGQGCLTPTGIPFLGLLDHLKQSAF